MKLEALQHLFFEWIAGATPPDGAEAYVHGGALQPSDRVGIYAEMYWLRMRDVLRDDFPFTRAMLGDDDFEVLVAKYIKGYPSRHHSLGELGRSLPTFLREQPVAALPWLGDLAALERARTEAFIAPDAPVLTPASLATLTPETFESARLHTTPSVRVLSLSADVLPAWQALSKDEPEIPTPELRATSVVVWRTGFEVFHVAVGADEANALRLAQVGEALPVVCEAFAEREDAAQAAFRAIGSWASEGMLRDEAISR